MTISFVNLGGCKSRNAGSALDGMHSQRMSLCSLKTGEKGASEIRVLCNRDLKTITFFYVCFQAVSRDARRKLLN